MLEPIASNVYFSPDVNDAFEALGFGPGVGAPGCLTIAEPSGYYCSRAACMGQVPGEVVVAAFGVFNPALIIPAVERGWSIATAAEVLDARASGAPPRRWRGSSATTPDGLAEVTAVLQRAAAAGSASGRFLYAGLRSLGIPPTPWGALWRAVDTIREHRGDSHIAAWIATGLDPVEIGLLTELYYGMPLKRYHRGRGWTDADLDAGLDRLRARGLIDGDPAAADAGRHGAAGVDRGGHRCPAAADPRGHRRRPRPRRRHARPVVGGHRRRRRVPEQRRTDPAVMGQPRRLM